MCTDRQTDRHARTDRPQGLGKGGHDTATPQACGAPAAAPIGEGNPWGPPQPEISIPATPQPHSLSCRPHQGPTGIPTPIFWGVSPPSYPPHPHHAPTPLERCPQGWGSQGWDAGGLGVLGGHSGFLQCRQVTLTPPTLPGLSGGGGHGQALGAVTLGSGCTRRLQGNVTRCHPPDGRPSPVTGAGCPKGAP